jgi:hypothetical protein
MIAFGALHAGEPDEAGEPQALDQECRHALIGLYNLPARDFRFAHLCLQQQKSEAEYTDRRQRHRNGQHEQTDRINRNNYQNAGKHDLPEHVVGGALQVGGQVVDQPARLRPVLIAGVGMQIAFECVGTHPCNHALLGAGLNQLPDIGENLTQNQEDETSQQQDCERRRQTDQCVGFGQDPPVAMFRSQCRDIA